MGNRGNGVEVRNVSVDDSVAAFGNSIGGADISDGELDGDVLARNVI